MAVTYIDLALLTESKQTETPLSGRTATGYGSKLPTRYLIKYAGKWRRVYAICYSNAASHYIRVSGQRLFLRDGDLT